MENKSIKVMSARTEDLTSETRADIVQVCVEAHQEQDFKNLFSYIPSGASHFLGYRDDKVVSHAMVTTRWLQMEDFPVLKTAYVDAVATLPVYQGQGFGSAVMRQLANGIEDHVIACLETERITFYERLGWELWLGPLAGRKGGELIPTPGQTGIMILRSSQTPQLDLNTALSIECQEDRIW
jgi:aminoglycoside 2'-N-acetyltransferase I